MQIEQKLQLNQETVQNLTSDSADSKQEKRGIPTFNLLLCTFTAAPRCTY
jgi:hypothetical protein